MDDIEIERVRVKTYDGSVESAKEVLKDLNVESNDYHYDIHNGLLILHSKGYVLQEGDSYHCKIPNEEFKAIG